jgi:hypothetical protein
MIQVRCDKCEKLLEAPDDLAGQKIECPSCGDVRTLPGAVAAVVETPVPVKPVDTRPDRAAAAGLPPDRGPEQRVLVTYPVMFRSSPLWGLILFVGVVGSIVGLVYFSAFTHPSLGATGAKVGIWISVATLVLSLIAWFCWWVAHLGTRLEVTSKRTVARRGLISRATTEVLHDDIKNVQIHQSVWQRILGIGRLSLSSSADDEAEIVVDDLPRPERIRKAIDVYRPL